MVDRKDTTGIFGNQVLRRRRSGRDLGSGGLRSGGWKVERAEKNQSQLARIGITQFISVSNGRVRIERRLRLHVAFQLFQLGEKLIEHELIVVSFLEFKELGEEGFLATGQGGVGR